MFTHPALVRQWLMVAAVVVAGVVLGVLMLMKMLEQRRPSELEREAQRRLHLALHGRIVDGSMVSSIAAEASEASPRVVIYRYRIAGVTYECAQDVSMLPLLVQHVRLDHPVQVRYNRLNPADSIVVAETWNGLWTNVWTGGRGDDLRTERPS